MILEVINDDINLQDNKIIIISIHVFLIWYNNNTNVLNIIRTTTKNAILFVNEIVKSEVMST